MYATQYSQPPRQSGPQRHQCQILRCVQQMMGACSLGQSRIERRGDRRFPFPYVMQLSPAGTGSEIDTAEPTIFIVGKHLSPHGLDFYHHDPLPYRHVILAVEDGRGQLLRLLMDVTWCPVPLVIGSVRRHWHRSISRIPPKPSLAFFLQTTTTGRRDRVVGLTMCSSMAGRWMNRPFATSLKIPVPRGRDPGRGGKSRNDVHDSTATGICLCRRTPLIAIGRHR